MIPFDDLPLDLAVKRVKGKGERKMAIFTDPDCPFCKRIEGDLAKVDNVTIYMFLFPIDSLHPKAADKAKRIWCSPDRIKAWDDYMQKGITPTAAPSCDNPVDKLVAVRYAAWHQRYADAGVRQRRPRAGCDFGGADRKAVVVQQDQLSIAVAPAGRDVGERDVYFRLLIALLLSAALHASFIYGVAPRPGALARPIAPLAARLIPEVARPAPAHAKRLAPAPPEAAAHVRRSPLTVPAAPPEAPLVAAPASNGAENAERREDSTLPKADLPFPVDLQWYEARDLDAYPRALVAFDPSYPPSAQADALRGAVTLLLAIDATGTVHDAAVVSAEPAGYFEAAALAWVRDARFAPGEKDGRAVRSKIVVNLRFAPSTAQR